MSKLLLNTFKAPPKCLLTGDLLLSIDVSILDDLNRSSIVKNWVDALYKKSLLPDPENFVEELAGDNFDNWVKQNNAGAFTQTTNASIAELKSEKGDAKYEVVELSLKAIEYFNRYDELQKNLQKIFLSIFQR